MTLVVAMAFSYYASDDLENKIAHLLVPVKAGPELES